MRLIVKPRQSGKTSELIRMSAETNAYILTLNRGMAEYVSKMAEQQGYNILFPITLEEYMRSRLKGSYVTHILIDNADMILQHIFSEATIDAITMSEQEPTVQSVPIPDNATNGDVLMAMFPNIIRTGTILSDKRENVIATNVNSYWWNDKYDGDDKEIIRSERMENIIKDLNQRLKQLDYKGCYNCKYATKFKQMCDWGVNGGDGHLHFICPRWEKEDSK